MPGTLIALFDWFEENGKSGTFWKTCKSVEEAQAFCSFHNHEKDEFGLIEKAKIFLAEEIAVWPKPIEPEDADERKAALISSERENCFILANESKEDPDC